MRRNETLQTLALIMKACNDMNLPSDKRVINHYAKCIEEMADDAIDKIQRQLEKPEIRSFRIPLIVDFDTMTNAYYWLNCKIFGKLPKERSHHIKDKLINMAGLLKALELKMKKVNAAYAEAFIKRMISISKAKIHVTDYDIWKVQHPYYDPEMLLDYQIQLTTKLLIEGVLAHDDKPKGKELQAVRVDLVKEGLEDGTELPDDFANECAKLKRYSYWMGSYRFMIDYQKIYRSQFINNFEKLTKKQRMLLFDYDVQMKQIHEDLERLLNGKMAEQQQTEQQDEQPQTEDLGELNFFAPAKSIKTMLQGEWLFYQRTDVKYTKDWMEAFVDALMESELGVLIAKEWQMKKKRERLKGNIIGCLRESGVLKGSYDTLAKNVGKEGRTFSRYICDGKKQPFNDWIMAYVGR